MSNLSAIVRNIRRKVAKKRWVSFTFRLSITLLLLVFLFKSLSWSRLFAALEHTTYVLLLLGLLIGVVASFVSAYQWQGLLRAEQIDVGLARLFKLYLIGIGFSHFLPTGMGGDVVKAFYVGRASGNYAGSASAVVTTRLTGYFGMQLLAFAALLLFHSALDRNLVLGDILFSLLVGSMIGGVLLLTLLLPKFLTGRDTSGPYMRKRLLAATIPVGEALLATMRRPALLCRVTAVGAVFWVLSVLDYYSYASALHMHVPLYFYFVAIPMVSLVAFLPITINGFGLRESAFVSVFATVHVPVASSLLLALMMDVQVLCFGIIGGCLYLTMSREERLRKQQGEREHTDRRGRVAEGAANVPWLTLPQGKASVPWFIEEDQELLDTDAINRVPTFDDSRPTLPMMLLAKPRSVQGEQAGLRFQDSTRRPRQQRFAASSTPVLQESRPQRAFGKNRRVILIKDEDEN